MRRRIFSESFACSIALVATIASGAAQDAPRVLFVGGQPEPAQAADADVWEKLVDWYGEANLAYVQAGPSSPDDAAGFDVVVLSSTPGSGDIRTKFRDLTIGVVNWEEALADMQREGNFNWTDGGRPKYQVTELEISDNSHPITEGLNLGVFEFFANQAETWGAAPELAPGVQVLAIVPGSEEAAISIAETGAELHDSANGELLAAGPRVMLGLTDASAANLSETGWELLKRSIEWAAGTLQQQSLDPDLIGWWRLNEGEGESVADSSGNHVPSTIENAGTGGLGADGSVWIDAEGDGLPGFLAGTKVASFNGTNGSGAYIFLGDEVLPLMTEDNGFTWAFWANSRQAPNNDIIFGNRYNVNGADFSPRQFIKFTTSKFEWDTNNVQGFDYDDIPQDEWMHHAIVKTGLEFAYYRNGELIDTGFADSAPEFIQPLYIAGQGVENWAGEMADVGIFSRALSGGEIAGIAANGIASLSVSGPSLYVDFNEGAPEGLLIINRGGESTEVRASGGVDDTGYLSVTDALNSQNGMVVFPDLLDGAAVGSFKFSMDVRTGGGTDSPADGFSINLVRPDDPLLTNPPGAYASSPGGEANLPEEGSQTGLGIGFDEWDSGAGDIVGFSVRVDNVLVKQVPAETRNGDPDDPTSLQTGPQNPDDPDDPYGKLTWQKLAVELRPDGTLDIFWKGTKIVSNLATNFFPSPVRIVLGGRTGGANGAHHVDNISLAVSSVKLAVLSRVSTQPGGFEWEFLNAADSEVDKESITLKVDGVAVEVVVTDTAGGVLVRYEPENPFSPGSTHGYVLVAQDTNGNAIGKTDEVTLRSAQLPYLTPLPGPSGEDGLWGVRYIWGTGTQVASTATALDWILRADDDDFEGVVHDTTAQVANLGAGAGLFADDEQYPEEVEFDDDGLWTGEDFVVLYKGTIRITEGGDYTFGVHSDDGFALRIHGAEFSSENGNGQIDAVQPNTLIHPAPTGDSNTRGVVRLQPGDYDVEFFWYERGGGDNGELYAAAGAFANDGDSQDWQLVGLESEGGLPLVGSSGGGGFQVTGISKAGASVVITWDSREGASYVIEKSADLGDFEELTDGFPSGGESTTFTDAAAGGPEAYYRVREE